MRGRAREAAREDGVGLLSRRAALLDLDGTLVDANYQHAFAWYRAFRRFDVVVPMWRVHRHIGMGGDQLVAAVAGDEVERRLGDALRDASRDEFAPLRDDLEFFVDRLGVRAEVDGWTTKDDVERSKPHPDVVHAALEKAGTRDAVMVGDSRWDIASAANAGLQTVCVITGGWSRQELRDHGAVAVFESLPELRECLDSTPLR